VFEEREGGDPDDPNYVRTRLGPIVSGGRVDVNSLFLTFRKMEERDQCNSCIVLN